MAIKRIREILIKEGIQEKIITESVRYGIGSSLSFLDAMLDIRLEGGRDPTTQEVWEGMKAQINFLTKSLINASNEYSIIEARIRGIKEDSRDLLSDPIIIKKEVI